MEDNGIPKLTGIAAFDEDWLEYCRSESSGCGHAGRSGRPKVLTERVAIMVSPEDLEAWRKAAAAEKCSLAMFIRKHANTAADAVNT